jgi:ubiquinone/menaquinone biosynthesis C-methylase UbiE
MIIDPKQFWNKKILEWEDGRYFINDGSSIGIFERVANSASSSLRHRMAITKKLLAPHIAGKKILEIGCGSGLLTKSIMENLADSYLGIDIAQNAISRAIKRNSAYEWSDRVRFEVGDLDAIPKNSYDIIVSLGLLDWLNDDQLKQIFLIGRDSHFLHAISEKRAHPHQWLHRAYVHLSYGYKTKSYVPRYFNADEIRKLAKNCGGEQIFFYRDSKLSFCTLATSLPTII